MSLAVTVNTAWKRAGWPLLRLKSSFHNWGFLYTISPTRIQGLQVAVENIWHLSSLKRSSTDTDSLFWKSQVLSDLCYRPQKETLLCAHCLLGAPAPQHCCKLSSLPAAVCIMFSITRDKMKNGPSNFTSFSFLLHTSYGCYDFFF